MTNELQVIYLHIPRESLKKEVEIFMLKIQKLVNEYIKTNFEKIAQEHQSVVYTT
jgi:hypothetical protein